MIKAFYRKLVTIFLINFQSQGKIKPSTCWCRLQFSNHNANVPTSHTNLSV